MENYFELQLEDGSIFKGTLSADRKSFEGPAVVVKKDTSVMIGRTVESEFEGFCACADIVENSVYLGSFSKSEKHGYGTLVKYR
jgi:L-amino acid N-acyltransferase YncA